MLFGYLKRNPDSFLFLQPSAAGDDEATTAFAVRAANVLIDFLLGISFDFIESVETPDAAPSSPFGAHSSISKTKFSSLSSPSSFAAQPSSSTKLNNTARLTVALPLWLVIHRLIPPAILATSGTAEILLACLMKNEPELVSPSTPDDCFSVETGDEDETYMRKRWTELCTSVLVSCDVETLRTFWGYMTADGDGEYDDVKKPWEWEWNTKQRSLVWMWFVECWIDLGCQEVGSSIRWEGALTLLGVPFMSVTVRT